ncbi:MAG: DNA repair protein RecO [Zoogloeaceae bacterium]|jgi:DNA repair protein RecO (recombination protein O)|nr:DNA repair protein RecO [Zoogloeaceae bacterium]
MSDSAFVLHARPYKETSLLLDVFGRATGRLPLLARGARRRESTLRGQLMTFTPLTLSWTGKGEVKTLTKAEWLGGLPMLRGAALLCGYYANELLLRLMPREDANPRLFDAYADALQALADSARPEARETALRRFEQRLLAELGYGLSLQEDACGQRVVAEADYGYEPGKGLLPQQGEEGGRLFSGTALLAMAADDYTSAPTRAAAKRLMRLAVDHALEGAPLMSRKLFLSRS